VKTGSFVYDVQLDVDEWSPTKVKILFNVYSILELNLNLQDELRVLSAQFVKIAREEHPFERLVVDADVAEEIFFDSPHKLEQIPQIATQLSDGNIFFHKFRSYCIIISKFLIN